ncbi:class I tRNA ligase family protein [Candidatus Dojkabacteria bacterium]|nr:class I tRNA ligase family protein [Candidatus Dojkabacteria bacterium]
MALSQGPYDPKEVEPRILKNWLDRNYYKPEFDPKTGKVVTVEELKSDETETFCLINPPPNAYDRPHIGNVSGYAYQDVFARYNRMKGKKVLMLPGKDHAGQEGEAVFIKNKLMPEGKSKADFTREEFYKICYKHNEENMDKALKDEQTIGLSSDFDRNVFTLDPRIVDTVLETFIQMYKDNMVYKGVRIINWSTGMGSAISDNDTARKERESELTYVKYPLVPEGKRVWQLSFYNETTVEALLNGSKTVETRALNPEEGWRYFGEIKSDDIIVAVNKSKAWESHLFFVESVRIYKDAIEFFNKEDFKKIYTDKSRIPKSVDEMITHYNELAEGYGEKLRKNGAIAITIKQLSNETIKQWECITVATSRPETMLGDTAVVVHPDDDRYKDLIGRYALLPLVNRSIPVIANSKVDKDFGTGAVKLTPAHSPDDYYMTLEWSALGKQLECEKNNDGKVRTDALGYVRPDVWKEIRNTVGEIDYINVIWKDSKMCGPIGKYKGLNVDACRSEVSKDLERLGLIERVEKIKQNVTICDRTKSIVEPIMSSQWFIDINKKNFKQNAIKALQAGLEDPSSEIAVNVHPSNMAKKAIYWLKNLRDWPISRSIWWGYRIPVWYKGEPSETVTDSGKIQQTIGGVEVSDMKEAYDKELLKVQVESPKGDGWIQDPDCLDTWFSSGQWPYATLKAWGILDKFYPTDVLDTAYDILEAWVCRMIMFGFYTQGKRPFKDVYLHGLVRAEDGQKMSKSKGNAVSIDDIIEKYGVDTLRMFFISGNKAGASYNVDYNKIEGYRRFLNKLWNASKFVLSNCRDGSLTRPVDSSGIKEASNKQICEHVAALQKKIAGLMDDFEIGLALYELTNEFWHSFCDIHIEASKAHIYDKRDKETKEVLSSPMEEEKVETVATLTWALRQYLKMLHPFIPFITEELWQGIYGEEKTLMFEKW